MSKSTYAASMFLATLVIYAALRAADAPKPTPAAKPPEPQANVIAGVVSDQDGNVLKGASVTVTLIGRTAKAGERAEYTATPGENGVYSSDVPEGTYKIWATADIEYNGRSFVLPLAPEDGKDQHAAHNSAKGIVKNFKLRLTGLKPGAKRGQYGSYWGQGILLFDADQGFDPANKLATKHPGSRVVVRLEPKGALIGGATTEPITLETPSDGLHINDPRCKHLDVPLGDYTATAKLVTKDGKELPLKISVGPRPQVRKPAIDAAASVPIEFFQSENNDIPAINLSFGE